MKTTKIINKVLEELKSESPKLDYIRGLLEGLVEEEEKFQPIMGGIINSGTPVFPGAIRTIPETVSVDEASILDSTAKANIDKIKSIAEASQQ